MYDKDVPKLTDSSAGFRVKEPAGFKVLLAAFGFGVYGQGG